jgi:hypothetical protein
MWLFRCTCGREKEVSGFDVVHGKSRSCGCHGSPVLGGVIGLDEAARQVRFLLCPDQEVRPIARLDGYFVSEYGDVFSWRSGPNPRRLRLHAHPAGYVAAAIISCTGERSWLTVHRLVAAAFIGPPPSARSLVRHLDGNRRNNHRGNLAYGTHADNAEDARRHGTLLVGSRVRSARLNEGMVKEIRDRFAAGESRSSLMARFNVCKQTVCNIINRRAWTHVV